MTDPLDTAVVATLQRMVGETPQLGPTPTATTQFDPRAHLPRRRPAFAIGLALACASTAVFVVTAGNDERTLSPADTTAARSEQPQVAPPTASTLSDPAPTIDPLVADLPSPIKVTGYRIGDQVVDDGQRPPGFDEDGKYDPSLMPAWVAVINDHAVVIGYVLGASEPTPQSPTQPVGPIVIYGETGERIGQFIDGSPVVDGSRR